MNLYQELHDYLVANLFKGNAPAGFDSDYQLIEDGGLDSLATMGLITHLESQYHIVFGDEDIVPEHFDSLAALVTFVESKRTSSEIN